MADITARLIWYRLGEVYNQLAESFHSALDWYTDFNLRRVDLLDMLFLGWILLAFLVVIIVNVYMKFFSPFRKKHNQEWNKNGFAKFGGMLKGESCNWINTIISWMFIHQKENARIFDSWIKSLNVVAGRQMGDIKLRFDQIHAGSSPPKISQINIEGDNSGSQEQLVLRASVESLDLTFSTTATSTSTKPVSNSYNSHSSSSYLYDIQLQKLRGQIRGTASGSGAQPNTRLLLKFVGRPDFHVQVKSRNSEARMDPKQIECLVTECITEASFEISLPQLSSQTTDQSLIQPSYADRLNTYSAPYHHNPTTYTCLLVKVIKASALGGSTVHDPVRTSPFCTIEVDSPPQRQSTSVVESTHNPFWDEHFTFDIDSGSNQLIIEIYNQSTNYAEGFLGRATLSLSDLKKMPSSRQIIPLTGSRSQVRENSPAGNITLEFLFSEEISGPIDAPRRRVEKQQDVLPSGTIITTTTTTTEKPRDSRHEPSYNETPNFIEKCENARLVSNIDFPVGHSTPDSQLHYSTQVEPHHDPVSSTNGYGVSNGRLSSPTHARDSVTDTALRQLNSQQQQQKHPSPRTPTRISSITITGLKQTTAASNVHDDSQDSTTMMNDLDYQDPKKGKISDTLKKTFGRTKKKSRSESRERSGASGREATLPRESAAMSRERPGQLHQDSYLRPTQHRDDSDLISSSSAGDYTSHHSNRSRHNPSYLDSPSRESAHSAGTDQSALSDERRRARPAKRSVSNSLRRLFNKKKPDSSSRDSSMSRMSTRSARSAGGGDVPHMDQLSPTDVSYRAPSTPDYERRPSATEADHYGYSMPASSPMHDGYSSIRR